MRFSYRQYIAEIPDSPDEFRIILRPVIPITVHGTIRALQWDALLDTGADETLIPASVGELVGVRWTEEESGQISGVGGHRLPVRYGEVDFELPDGTDSVKWSAIVGFADFDETDDAPLILGHDAFLELFTATFHGGSAEIELVANELFDEVKRQ